MATVDTAYTFFDIGKYLVALQEVEPGNGWLYSGWLVSEGSKTVWTRREFCDKLSHKSAGREQYQHQREKLS